MADGTEPAPDRDDATGAELGAGTAIGIAIGVAVGTATDDLALWLPMGVALGAGWTARE